MDRSEIWWAWKGTKNQRQSMQSKSDNSKNVHITFGWHVLMCLPWKTETSISPNANALIWFGIQLSKTQFGSQSHFFRDCDALGEGLTPRPDRHPAGRATTGRESQSTCITRWMWGWTNAKNIITSTGSYLHSWQPLVQSQQQTAWGCRPPAPLQKGR